MDLIDTHAHIYLSDFEVDRGQILQEAQAQNIKHILLPHIDSQTTQALLQLAEQYPDICRAMIGLHPCSVKANFEQELSHVTRQLAQRPNSFCAIGEIGTDLYWDTTFFEQQKEAFRFQIGLAKEYHLPIVIHCRNSIHETIALLQTCFFQGLKGVFHCFSGDLAQAQTIIEMGFYLGIGGVATFKNGGLDKVLPHIPLTSLVLETDSPYLAPVPYRGKRNQPAYLPIIAQKVADFQKVSLAEVAQVTTQNAIQLFGL
ncbi:MAG: TatD family hydrolase [Microscillaceae bacterium]|nr:TatD family hydrolase [Microscillaceae bacterium]MDW8460866.1 TatD family hydrolase [Cytophagales bacterium]